MCTESYLKLPTVSFRKQMEMMHLQCIQLPRSSIVTCRAGEGKRLQIHAQIRHGRLCWRPLKPPYSQMASFSKISEWLKGLNDEQDSNLKYGNGNLSEADNNVCSGSGTLQSSSSMVLRQDQENAKELASVSSPELLSALAETTLTEPSGEDLSLPAIQEGDEILSTPSASLQRQGSASSSRFRSSVRFQNSGDRTSQQQQSLEAVLEFLAGELRGKLNISQQQVRFPFKQREQGLFTVALFASKHPPC